MLSHILMIKVRLLILAMVGLLLSFLMLIVLAPRAHATSYNVNVVSNPTGCGFLEALAEINATHVPGATCAAAAAPNTINLAAGTYILPSSIPPITTDGDLTITGDNANNTILEVIAKLVLR